MGKILPILLAILGIGAGVGAGIFLKPSPEEMAMANPCGEDPNRMEPSKPAKEQMEEEDQQGGHAAQAVDRANTLVHRQAFRPCGART